MKLGLLVESEEDLTWERWRHIVALAEQLGFESLAISDHLLSPTGARGIDPWLALAVAASETRQLRLATLVSPITFYASALLARMTLSLHDASGGRFVLGLGLGWNAAEHAATGIPFPPVMERMRRLTEAIQRVREWLGDRSVPLLIGGGGARSTLPLVAQFADEWNLTTSSPALYSEKRQDLEAACVEVGRHPSQIQRSVAVGYLVGRSESDIIDRSRRMQPGFEPGADVRAAARERGWVAGLPSEIVAQLAELERAGVQRALLGHYLHDDDAALELMAAEIIPRVRETP